MAKQINIYGRGSAEYKDIMRRITNINRKIKRANEKYDLSFTTILKGQFQRGFFKADLAKVKRELSMMEKKGAFAPSKKNPAKFQYEVDAQKRFRRNYLRRKNKAVDSVTAAKMLTKKLGSAGVLHEMLYSKTRLQPWINKQREGEIKGTEKLVEQLNLTRDRILNMKDNGVIVINGVEYTQAEAKGVLRDMLARTKEATSVVWEMRSTLLGMTDVQYIYMMEKEYPSEGSFLTNPDTQYEPSQELLEKWKRELDTLKKYKNMKVV